MVSNEGMHFHLSVFIQFSLPFLQRWWYSLLRFFVKKNKKKKVCERVNTSCLGDEAMSSAVRACVCEKEHLLLFSFFFPLLLSSLAFSFTSARFSQPWSRVFLGPLYTPFLVSLNEIRGYKRSQPCRRVHLGVPLVSLRSRGQGLTCHLSINTVAK